MSLDSFRSSRPQRRTSSSCCRSRGPWFPKLAIFILEFATLIPKLATLGRKLATLASGFSRDAFSSSREPHDSLDVFSGHLASYTSSSHDMPPPMSRDACPMSRHGSAMQDLPREAHDMPFASLTIRLKAREYASDGSSHLRCERCHCCLAAYRRLPISPPAAKSTRNDRQVRSVLRGLGIFNYP